MLVAVVAELGLELLEPVVKVEVALEILHLIPVLQQELLELLI
jgi:hypothetical protein